MSLTGSLVTSAYLALPNPVYFDNAEEQAARHLAKAIYFELEIDKTVKRLEKRHTPQWVYKYGPYVGPVLQIATERRITYTWRF